MPGNLNSSIASRNVRAYNLSKTDPSDSIKYGIPAFCKAFVKSL